MKKLLLLIGFIFLLFSCWDEFKPTKENIEATYKIEDRSLNLENKNINASIRLNNSMSWTEVNNIFLWNNNIQVIDVSWFEKLGTLEIDNNDIKFITDLKLPLSIRHLNLSHNHLSSLEWLENYTNLKTLDLSYNDLEDDDIVLSGLTRLKYINIVWNNISEELLKKIDLFNSIYLSNNEVPFMQEK